MITRHICAIVTACCLFLPASAIEAEIDRERMQQDLDIMEGILKSLHAQNTPNPLGIHREPQVRGLYFENYGVIFLIEERGTGELGHKFYISRYLEKPAGASEKLEVDDVRKDIVEQREKRRGALKDRLAEFLGTYADGIRQLRGDDQITILVHHQPRSRTLIDAEKALAGELEYIWPIPDNRLQADLSEQAYSEVTAKKSDIVAYRREHISEAEFRKRVVSRDRRTDASMMKKIGVMAAILDKALKQPKYPVPKSNATLGIYQKGLGALFFVNAKSGYPAAYHVNIGKAPRQAVVRIRPGKRAKGERQAGRGRPTEGLPHRMRSGKGVKVEGLFQERFKEELVEVVGDYGYTLRTLKSEEYIVVEVRFPPGLPRRSSGPRGLVLTVQKKNVDAYSRGDLDLAAFRKKVEIQEY